MAKVGHDPGVKIDLNKMSGWELTSFGEPSAVLKLNQNVPMPIIKKPTQIIVKVLASSVNRMDVMMMRGYGANLIHSMREKKKGQSLICILCKEFKLFPYILGRDVAGIVTQMGSAVRRFEIGDHVYGFVPVTEDGAHAEYCLVDREWMQPKPVSMSFTEAASIPYVSMVTWVALRHAGKYSTADLQDKKFLILGGSGGVGTFAIQYLKAKGAKVTTTCSASTCTLVNDLGADFILDYRTRDYINSAKSYGPYDCILDVTPKGLNCKKFLDCLKRGGQFITLTSPAAHNSTKYGIAFGPLKNKMDLIKLNLSSYFSHHVSIKWATFNPDGRGWKEISDLVNEGKIKPVVEKVYKYSELPEAYSKLSKGHSRGKIVIESK